jgi:hypothetical protein
MTLDILYLNLFKRFLNLNVVVEAFETVEARLGLADSVIMTQLAPFKVPLKLPPQGQWRRQCDDFANSQPRMQQPARGFFEPFTQAQPWSMESIAL